MEVHLNMIVHTSIGHNMMQALMFMNKPLEIMVLKKFK